MGVFELLLWCSLNDGLRTIIGRDRPQASAQSTALIYSIKIIPYRMSSSCISFPPSIAKDCRMLPDKTVPQLSIDPFSDGFLAEPYAHHDLLRDAGPVF